jgi:hypothetical protein
VPTDEAATSMPNEVVEGTLHAGGVLLVARRRSIHLLHLHLLLDHVGSSYNFTLLKKMCLGMLNLIDVASAVVRDLSVMRIAGSKAKLNFASISK